MRFARSNGAHLPGSVGKPVNRRAIWSRIRSQKPLAEAIWRGADKTYSRLRARALGPGFSPSIDIHFLTLVLVLVVAAGLRFYDLDRTSLWNDEAVSWSQASQPFFKMIVATAHDNYPPLHNILLHVVIALFGDSEISLRAPSALLGVATAYAIYRLGAIFWDRTTGLLAALLLTLSSFHIWYSTEARMYALLAFTATLFVLTVVQSACRPNWKTLAGCAAAGTILLYSHVYGSFVFVGVNLFVLMAISVRAEWVKVGWKSWAATQGAATALFLPWALILWERVHAVTMPRSIKWIPKPTSEFVLHQFEFLAGGTLPLLILAMLALLSIINIAKFWASSGAVTCTSMGESLRWLRLEWQNGIVLAWLIAPILAGYSISLFFQPIFVDRYLICSLPAFFLLTAVGIRSIAASLGTALALVALVVCVSIPSASRAAFLYLRDDFKIPVEKFSSLYIPSDRVIFMVVRRQLLVITTAIQLEIRRNIAQVNT